MAQRPTPKPSRATCPFCSTRIVDGTTLCPSCRKSFKFSDIEIISELLKSQPSFAEDTQIALDELELAIELERERIASDSRRKIEENQRKVEEEARKSEEEIAKKLLEVQAKQELRALKIASLPKIFQIIIEKRKKIMYLAIALSLISFTSIVVKNTLEEQRVVNEVAAQKVKQEQHVEAAYKLADQLSKILLTLPENGKIYPYTDIITELYSSFEENKKSCRSLTLKAETLDFFEGIASESNIEEVPNRSFLANLIKNLKLYADDCASEAATSSSGVSSEPSGSPESNSLESPIPMSEAELQSLETQTQADLNLAQSAFCIKVESLGLSKIKSLDPGQGEPPEFLVLEDLYGTVAKIESEYNFNTGKQLKNDLGPYWSQWSIAFTTVSSLGDYKQQHLNESVNLFNYCRSNNP